MALGNITLRSTASSSVVNLKANVDASIDIVNRPLTHEEVDLNFLEIGASLKSNLISSKTTDNLAEGSSNLYFTNARVGTYLTGTAKLGDLSDVQTPGAAQDKFHIYYDHSTTSIKFGDFSSTDKLPEGTTNLYYTNARADARIAAASTTDLSEGSNLYYTDARFDTRFGTKTTADLTEHATMLYFTNARADARADVRIAASSLNALSDVDTTGAASGKILQHNGTSWVVVNSTTTTLSGMTDTTITGPSNGQVLKYNGTAWVNSSDLNNNWDADLKANVLTSSTSDVKASTYANKNVILDLNANASIVANSSTAVGDAITTAYLNTTTNINTAVNMSDLIVEGDLLSGITLKNNSNNANVTNVGAQLSSYNYQKDGLSAFNISLFDDTRTLHDSYIKAKQNGYQWQFKTTNESASAAGETKVSIFAGDSRGKIIHENRGYDNLRRYAGSPITDAVAYGPINVEHTGKDFKINASDYIYLDADGGTMHLQDGTAGTFGQFIRNNANDLTIASGTTQALIFTGADVAAQGHLTVSGEIRGTDIKLRPTGKLDIGAYPGSWDATTQARIQKVGEWHNSTADNTKRHYNIGQGGKITLTANVDSGNRKQGVLNDTRFDLAGFTFGADNPTNIYRMLGGSYDWASPENSGSATTLSGLVARHMGADVGGSQNLTITNLAGATALAGLDDSTSSVTNLIGLIAHTSNDSGTATNRYSVYAPEANDTAYFAGTVKANKTVHGVQNISGAGAISLAETVTLLTTTGTNAYTLADGVEGQIKIISMKVDGGDATVTPTNFVNGTSIVFNDVEDTITLLYQTTGWVLLARQNATVI